MRAKSFVLVVEENLEVRESLRDILQVVGYSVSIAADPEAAIEQILNEPARERPDVVVLGQKYSNHDRSAFLQRFHAQLVEAGNISVVVFSTFAVNLPHENGAPKQKPACLLSSVAQLLTLLRGLGRHQPERSISAH